MLCMLICCSCLIDAALYVSCLMDASVLRCLLKFFTSFSNQEFFRLTLINREGGGGGGVK